MLQPPEGLDDREVAEGITAGWGIELTAIEWLAVGFGSHHWAALDDAGRRWFVTVDDLDQSVCARGEGHEDTYERLGSALGVATAAHASGLGFVVAPVPCSDGPPLRRLTERHALAVYPHIDGTTLSFGERRTIGERLAILDLLVELHGTDELVVAAPVDDLEIASLPEVSAALDPTMAGWAEGPYGSRSRELLLEAAEAVQRMIHRHQELATRVRAAPDRWVVTHGEPHPGNTIRTRDGWALVDWDTARAAPPERDLWLIGATTPQVLDVYEARTGRAVDPDALEAYELTWRLGDLAFAAARFRERHDPSPDADESWDILRRALYDWAVP